MKKTDKKMLQLIDILKAKGTIRFDVQFCDVLGLHKSNFVKIKKGTNSFTVEHIEIALTEYKVNANWMFADDEKVFRKQITNKELTTK